MIVQEIEKRGLDIIGLYRLCGSETKKKMLREAFETNPEAVDLSSENVPDINVITSEALYRYCCYCRQVKVLDLDNADQLIR